MAPHIAVIEARFYTDIADELYAGAQAHLDRRGATHERIAVPGVLEIPAALAMIEDSGGTGLERRPQGYVLLGCVIRGETTHYDIVANESARAILALVSARALAVGNGIQTVENREQALARARVNDRDKGGGAAAAALAMVALRERFGVGNG